MPTVYTAVPRHLDQSVRQQWAPGTVLTQRTFCLGKQEVSADKMLQTATRAAVFLSRAHAPERGKGLHGNCLIICWELLPWNEVTGLSPESRGPEPCLYTRPSVGAFLHSQEPGRKERE